MARKASPIIPQPAQMTVQEMKKALPRLRRRLAEVEAFDPNALTEDNLDVEATRLKTSIEEALARTFGTDTTEYQTFIRAAYFYRSYRAGGRTPIARIREDYNDCKRTSLALLRQTISTLEERIEEEEGDDVKLPSARVQPDASNRKAFVVHGHDAGPKEAVARFLEKIGFEAIILHEHPNSGRTTIEKFEVYADVGFAVVLLTPDDVGAAKDEEPKPRARQNVVLELGYFIGHLGRDRVCALKMGEIELPSDVLGVLWTNWDTDGAWKQKLAGELQSSGFEIDWNKVMA